ncbi:MAG TPA: hypothetical protein VGE80_01065 [Schlesneria sp.]
MRILPMWTRSVRAKLKIPISDGELFSHKIETGFNRLTIQLNQDVLGLRYRLPIQSFDPDCIFDDDAGGKAGRPDKKKTQAKVGRRGDNHHHHNTVGNDGASKNCQAPPNHPICAIHRLSDLVSRGLSAPKATASALIWKSLFFGARRKSSSATTILPRSSLKINEILNEIQKFVRRNILWHKVSFTSLS